MESQIVPVKEGQVCKIVNPMEDENPEDVYILTEDPTPYTDNDNIYIVNLNDLQRNINRPAFAPTKAVKKIELTVIAENLEEYISTWNNS